MSAVIAGLEMFARQLDHIGIDGPWRGKVMSRQACWPKLMALAAILWLAHSQIHNHSVPCVQTLFALGFTLRSQGFIELNQMRPSNDTVTMEIYLTMFDYGQVFASQTQSMATVS